MLQRIDKELEEALATLEKEKDGALQDLDAQVRPPPCFTRPGARSEYPFFKLMLPLPQGRSAKTIHMC